MFLVGYPRSGTTLIEQLLDSHPSLVSMEEKPVLFPICEKFHKNKATLKSLASIEGEELKELRSEYWRLARCYTPQLTDGLTLVDKYPLNICYLDCINAFFPHAKVIVVLRDPRDVALSNFLQRYKLNPGMCHHLSLEKTARLYDAILRFYLQCREILPLDIFEIRYELLVADMPGVMRETLAFIREEWDDNVFQYAHTAKKKKIKTPSYRQVVKPIYADSIGRWKNYRLHLETVLPILEPWVERFGYDPSDL